MLHHVSLQVAGLGESLVAHLALVGSHAPVGKQVCVQVAQLLEQLPAQIASMWLDTIVPQDMCDQVVLGSVGFLTHTTLPSLLISSHVHIVTVIYMDAEAKLFSTGRPTAWRYFMASMPGAELLSWVERTRGEGHDRAGHQYGVWQEVVVERWEVGRVEEKGRGRPNRRRSERLLFHLRR